MKRGALDVSSHALSLSGGWDGHPSHAGQGVVTAAPEQDFGSLLDEWGIPPFSVLDTRQGYWQERRRRWLALGMQSELGRDAAAYVVAEMRDGTVIGASGMQSGNAREMASASGRHLLPGPHASDYGGTRTDETSRKIAAAGGASNGTSIFDPVLCEVAYRWWCRPGGTVLDPFAGGSVRGLVAARMGHPYIGVDLSARQVAANEEQAYRLLEPGDPEPRWVVGDSADLLRLVPDVRPDLVFTCPPYYDLEVYSEDPRDLSAMGTYAEFREAYRAILAAAVGLLAPEGFAVLVVSEVRGTDGTYLGLVPDTVAALNDAGAPYYNEAILVNSAGSLPLRAGQYMKAGRKLGRCHQNVIVGRKGSGSTRAWDHQREAPSDPQLGMFS